MKTPAKVHTDVIVDFFWDAPDAPKPREKHNVYHMFDRHNVSTDEVEQVLEGSPVVLDVQHLEGRNPVYGVVGYTASGRLLEVWGLVFRDSPYVGFWRTITAMDADDDARNRYLKERGGMR